MLNKHDSFLLYLLFQYPNLFPELLNVFELVDDVQSLADGFDHSPEGHFDQPFQ